MNKKILIASLFATLMLLVPMTSVVGVSDVEDDCGCQVVNRYDLFRVKLLLVRLKVFTNILLLRFGHIPEVAEKYSEISDIINSNRQLDNPIICDILESILNQIDYICYNLFSLWDTFKNNPIIAGILSSLMNWLEFIELFVYILGLRFNCEWAEP
jgi:hypothetical protein